MQVARFVLLQRKKKHYQQQTIKKQNKTIMPNPIRINPIGDFIGNVPKKDEIR